MSVRVVEKCIFCYTQAAALSIDHDIKVSRTSGSLAAMEPRRNSRQVNPFVGRSVGFEHLLPQFLDRFKMLRVAGA